MSAMHVAFVVFVVKGSDGSSILPESVRKETQAVDMGIDDAAKLGFDITGLKVPAGQDVRIVIVAKRDAPWITRSLEGSDAVAGFQMVDVNIG
jgi:hypothetical protein